MPKTIRVILLVLFAQAITCHAINVILLRDPGLLAPSAVAQLAGGFAQGQISFAFLALAMILHFQFRWRWIPGFAALYFLTLGVEWLGTRFGFPFGSYYFFDMLGIKWLGQVPALIPLAWFNIAVPSFVVASLSFRGTAGRVVAGAARMLAWDLCTDPLIGHHTIIMLGHSEDLPRLTLKRRSDQVAEYLQTGCRPRTGRAHGGGRPLAAL